MHNDNDYPVTSDTIEAAIDEAWLGGHVAHITKDGRTIAIRPWYIGTPERQDELDAQKAAFTLTWCFGPNDDQHNVPCTWDEVRGFISALLDAHIILEADETLFDIEINQGIRECEIIDVKRTRIRIAYEMPNAGLMHGWRKYQDVGSTRCIW